VILRRLQKSKLGDALERHGLEVCDSVPGGDAPTLQEDGIAQLRIIQLYLHLVKRTSAFGDVSLECKHAPLLPLHCGSHLLQTVDRLEVSLREEDADGHRPVDVNLQVANVREVVDICRGDKHKETGLQRIGAAGGD